MTGTSEDLLQAVYGLRKAAEAQFTGNDYYQVANEIAVLIENLGGGDGTVPAGQDAAYGFATMLDEVRRLAKANTSGSQYNVIARDIDRIASFLTPAAEAPATPAPASEKPASAAPAAAAAAPAPSSKPETPVDLMQAVLGLRRAAEDRFPGSAYHEVGKEIDGLIETLGGNEGSVPPGKDATYGFATMLDEVRRLAGARTSGNQYYSIVVKLDRLSSYVTWPATATETAAAPAAAHVAAPVHTPSAAKPTFADLAADSKARVEEVAASLGIAAAHHAAPVQQEAETVPEPEVLEKRSSEPCAMPELAPVAPAAAVTAELAAASMPADHAHEHAGGGDAAKCPYHSLFAETAGEPAAEPSTAHPAAPSQAEAEEAPGERRLESRSSEDVRQPLESVEPAAIAAEAAPEPIAAETAPDLGSPAAQGEVFVIEETTVVEVATIAVEPAIVEQIIEAADPAGTKRKEPKTLFRLWLDLAFGRKD
ncbi:MAG: hypothetical protein ACLPX9_02450 [Rhodomicrobium sp.]